MTEVVESQLEALAEIDVATIYEAQGAYNALPPEIRTPHPGTELTGVAYPVSASPGDNLWLHRAVAMAPAGAVLVVSTGGRPEHGYWGEVLAEAAMAAGIRGLVIDGGVRDVRALGSLGFPVFARRIDIRGTTKDPALPGGAGTAVRIGDVRVAAGDVVRGDDDGVVIVEGDRLGEVLEASRARIAKEADFIRRLRAGESSLDLYGFPPAPGAS